MNSLDLLSELPIRNGHFVLESGYHTDVWLTLDAVFCEPRAISAAVATLAEQLRAHDITAVCGPLLGGAFLAQALAISLQLRFYHTTPSASQPVDTLFGARYELPVALQHRAADEQFAVVDDVISAGSSVRASIAALEAASARVVAVGTLLLLGDAAADHFAERKLPLVALARRDFNLWKPQECPLCAAGNSAARP
jgi:orotate phosphoribosyltransferase